MNRAEPVRLVSSSTVSRAEPVGFNCEPSQLVTTPTVSRAELSRLVSTSTVIWPSIPSLAFFLPSFPSYGNWSSFLSFNRQSCHFLLLRPHVSVSGWMRRRTRRHEWQDSRSMSSNDDVFVVPYYDGLKLTVEADTLWVIQSLFWSASVPGNFWAGLIF